jgi:hypothetical protein
MSSKAKVSEVQKIEAPYRRHIRKTDRPITDVIRYREGDPSSSRKSPGKMVVEPRNDLIRICDPTGVLNTSLKDITSFLW